MANVRGCVRGREFNLATTSVAVLCLQEQAPGEEQSVVVVVEVRCMWVWTVVHWGGPIASARGMEDGRLRAN